MEQACDVEGVDVACSTSTSDKLYGRGDEIWTVPDEADDDARSITHCHYCSNALFSAYDINSVIAGVEHGSVQKCVAVSMIDVACGCDAAAATMIDVGCGPDDAAGVVDVVDVDCELEDVLQRSDGSVVLKNQFDRHTFDLLAYHKHCILI